MRETITYTHPSAPGVEVLITPLEGNCYNREFRLDGETLYFSPAWQSSYPASGPDYAARCVVATVELIAKPGGEHRHHKHLNAKLGDRINTLWLLQQAIRDA